MAESAPAPAPSAAALMPSQVIRSSSGNGNGNSNGRVDSTSTGASANGKSNNSGNGKSRARRNRNKKSNNNTQNNSSQKDNSTGGKMPEAKKTGDGQTSHNESNQNQNKPKAKRRNRKKPNNNSNSAKDGEEGETKQGTSESQNDNKASSNQKQNSNNNNGQKGGNNKNANNKKGRNSRARSKKKFPWRKHIPAGSVDPITLEALVSLPYPPFALRSSAPYLPVPEWPPKDESEAAADKKPVSQAEAAREWERKMLQEQWGTAAVLPVAAEEEKGVQEEVVSNPKHLNLFDGRALAYYMVSQLQFIDPLNRRDLTRDELCHLDRYLVRHGFDDLNVVEAYDTKGVSLSSAGAASTTAAGRAEILQQEARALLNALFGHSATAGRQPRPRANNSNNNSLQDQYSNYQVAQQQFQRDQEREYNQYTRNNDTNYSFAPDDDTGIYGDDGVLVIDDDLNPSLRGSRDLRPTAYSAANASNSSNTTLWSASRVTTQHGQQASLQQQDFPALASTAAMPPNQSSLSSSAPTFQPSGDAAAAAPAAPAPAPKPNKPLPPAKTLKFISKAVKKTTPEEAQRQFEAREEARKKAMLSNLTFGSNPASWETPTNPMAPPSVAPTEAQLERNKAFAEALGVAAPPPATAKLQGWARPTDATAPTTIYPDALILQARENMGALLKLERKWKAFLEDDKAASLPLNKMDSTMRKFVHEYSDFWKLHTESFDPEPNRYIHCVKLLDTSAPCPLLSDAARNWRGPTGNVASSEHALQQTAGQDTRGREAPRAALLAGLPTGPASSLEPNPRAAASAREERPKLELKERTLPLELPPFQPSDMQDESGVDTEELVRRRQTKQEEQKRRQREREERKQRVLEAAFASDSEEESLGQMDDDSDWEEGEELYPGSDDEKEAVEAAVDPFSV